MSTLRNDERGSYLRDDSTRVHFRQADTMSFTMVLVSSYGDVSDRCLIVMIQTYGLFRCMSLWCWFWFTIDFVRIYGADLMVNAITMI